MENFQKPSAPDGAFERFLTAALATIITIMFSWRLLTEENEGEDGDPRNVLLNYKPPIRPESSDNSDGDKDHISYESKEIRDISICGVNTPVEDTADRVVIPGESSAVQVVNDDEAHGDYCPSDDEDSPTWANYSWEEDMYGTVHTRRSVSDFVSSARQNSMTNENNDPSTTSNTLPVSPEQLEELYVNREYRSIVDNANYENMAISDSSESDSDDGEFELTNVDSEDDIYYPKPLEPIIEEDSDYDESASDSSSGDRNYFINNTPVCEPQILSTQCSNDILEDEKLVESAHGIIKSDKNAEIDHVKETCTLSGDKSSIEQSINSISTHVNTQEEIVLADLDDVCNEFDENDDDIKDYDDDSLPPSPVRTYALDDEGNLSDESCSTCSSSASVITVVSVDNVNKSKEKVENSVNDKNATGTTQAERDDLNSQEVNDNLHTDLIAFIHEGERSSIEQTDSLFTKNILPEQSSVGVIDTSQDLNSIYQDLQINTELPTITQKSKSSDDIDFSNQNENQSDENDDTTLDYEDFVNNIEANSENNLVIQTISPVCESVEQIQEPKDLDKKFEDEIDSEVSNEQARKSDTGSDVSQSDDEIDRFDDNIQPREYNPSDDDFCDFLLDQESDDDSFFVFVGNQNHLRKLDTVTNLDYIGKSQARDDLRNLSSSDDERTYVFSRTEEISTEHRFRCYVKDRENAELSSSDDNLIDVEEVDLHIQESAEGIGESDSKKSDELFQITERDDLLQITECDEESLENIDSGSKDDITEERIRQLNAVNAAINNTDLILAETIDSACTSPQGSLHNVRENGVNGHKENNAIFPELSPPPETNSDLVSDNIDLEYVKNETKIDDICDTKSPVETNTEFYSQTEQSDTNKNKVTELLRTDETDDLVDSQTEFQSESLLCSDTLVQRNHEPDINYVALNSEESNANVDFDNNVETFTEKDTLTRQISHQLEFISNADAISHDQTTNADKLLSSTDTNNGSHKSDHIVDANGNSKTCNENECKMSNLDNVSLDSVTISDLEQSILPCIEKLTESTQNGNGIQNTKTAVKSPDTNAKQQGVDYTNYERNLDVWNNYLDKSSRVVHTSVQTPSTFNLNGIKAKISKKQQEQQRKQMSELKYNSVLLRPISNDKKPSIYVMSAPKAEPCRQKISASKQQFLSAENLLPDNFKEQFAQHKTSLTNSVPRRNRYSKRDHVSAKLSRKNLSMDRIDHISSYYASRYSSDDSFEKPELDALHENCIFSPHKHKEILDTTQSIDNLNSSLSQFESNLMRYGSVASLETDIDSGETHETIYIFPDTNLDNPFGFQHLHQRSHSMSELTANTNKTKSSRGRFAERNFKKAKSLQTLETNIDDVFTAKGEGNLTRVPSVHELRVSKSLQKLNVPDWFKNSSVSRSGSTFSLYGSQRRESTSTTSSYGYPLSLASSPCPSVGPAGNPVVIKTRVTPHSARLIRSPNLPMTPERAPIAPTNFQLPSDKLRNKEKPKELMPIPIVPFSKLRLMFETKSSKDRQPVKVSSKSPTTPDPPMSLSVANTSSESPKPRSPPPTNKSKEMSLSASNPVKLPPSILKKPSSLAKSPEESSLKDEQVLPSAEKVEKKTMQQVEFTNGDLKSEPYSQRRIPQTENHQEKNGSLSKPDQTNSEAPNYQNEHNSKPVRYDVAPQSQKPPLQPKPNSRKIMPRNPVAANTTSQQSRKETTV